MLYQLSYCPLRGAQATGGVRGYAAPGRPPAAV